MSFIQSIAIHSQAALIESSRLRFTQISYQCQSRWILSMALWISLKKLIILANSVRPLCSSAFDFKLGSSYFLGMCEEKFHSYTIYRYIQLRSESSLHPFRCHRASIFLLVLLRLLQRKPAQSSKTLSHQLIFQSLLRYMTYSWQVGVKSITTQYIFYFEWQGGPSYFNVSL